MLRPRVMSHLLIAASIEQMDPIIRELYSHRVFHIEDFVEQEGEEYEGLRIGNPLPGATEASTRLIRIRSIESTFGVRSEDLTPEKRKSAALLRAEIDRDLAVIGNEVDELLATRATLDASLKEREQQVRELQPFAAVPLDIDMYRGYERIAVFTGRIPRDLEIPVPHEKIFSGSKEGNFIAVFTPLEYRPEVEEALLAHQFTAIPVPQGTGVPAELLKEYEAEIARLKEGIKEVDERIAGLKEKQTEFLAACEELLTMDVEQAEAPLRFAMTDQAFLAEGWVPIEELERMKSGIALATGGKAFVSELGIEEHKLPPVEYDNPGFAKPTQLFMDVYSRPRYDELDPTLLVSIIFPIFFGIILGDVGYGLILLAISFGLRGFAKGSEDLTRLLAIMRIASISSIIFGILYSEFFGFELPWSPFLFARHLSIGAEAGGHGPDVIGLMIFAIWIGILQITLGRILSGVNHYRHHGIKGLLPQLGWIGAMWGILLLIWSSAAIPLMPDLTGMPVVVLNLTGPQIVGAIMLLGGIVAIASESALELIELPTMISHTMSYARLVAVGLSSVAIAMVVNFIAIGFLIEPHLEEITAVGIVFIVMGVVVFIVGHLGNIALGMIGGGLQSLRLQYVEFFTKFYKGGGEKYNPFGKIKRFTEE
jgi:V/A-type H+-transporting ATPase subunit I